MAGRKGGGRQRPIKGFRPGKEPPQLRKQQARAQLGPDAGWAQKRLVDTLADRSPEEARRMMHRWRLGSLILAVLLLVVGALLYGWSIVAGIAVHLIAVLVLVLWLRLRQQQARLDALIDMVGGRKRR